MNEISPKYLMMLIDKIESVIWANFKSYKKVKQYIQKWHFADINYENFPIVYQDNGKDIDLSETLHAIEDGEIVLKIAIDLSIETPDFIPSIPVFRNNLKNSYKRASDSFNEAIKNITEQPSISIGLANSTLESIIKYIFEDENIKTKSKNGDTLYKQTENILKEFSMFPGSDIPKEIRDMGSALLKVSKSIEDIRSNKTFMHGKTDSTYLVEESIYAVFIVNVVASIGLFLINFYELKYKNIILNNEGDWISTENIPF